MKMKKNKYIILSVVCIFAIFSCTSERETAFTRMEAHFSGDTLKHAIAKYYEMYARYHHGVTRTFELWYGGRNELWMLSDGEIYYE